MPVYDAYRAVLIALDSAPAVDNACTLAELLCKHSTIPPSSQILIDASGRQIILGDRERDKDVLRSGLDIYLFDRRLIEESRLLTSTEIPISELDLLDFSQESIPAAVLSAYCQLLMKSTADHFEHCQAIWVSLSIYHGALLAAYTNYRHYVAILADQWRVLEQSRRLKSRLKSLGSLVEHFQTNWTLMLYLPFSDSLRVEESRGLEFLIDLFDRQQLESAYHSTSRTLAQLDTQVKEAAALISDITTGPSPALAALERMKLALDDKSVQLVEADRHLSQLDLLYYNIQQDFLADPQAALSGAELAAHSSLESLISIENQSTNMTLEFVKGREEFSMDFQSCLKWISERQNDIRSAQSMTLALESMLSFSASPLAPSLSASPPTSPANMTAEHERLLTQFHRTPSLYFAALMEIVRRKNYSQLRQQRLALVNEALQSIQANEAKRRQRFEAEIVQQFPRPSMLAFLSPSGRDESAGGESLPNLTLEQIQHYAKILEDLAQTATLTEAEISPLPAPGLSAEGEHKGPASRDDAALRDEQSRLNKRRIWKLLSTIKEVLNYLTFMPREFDQILSSSRESRATMRSRTSSAIAPFALVFDDRVTRLEAENAALKMQLQTTGAAATTSAAATQAFKDASSDAAKSAAEGYEQKLKGYEERIRGLESALQSSYSALKEASGLASASKDQIVENKEKENKMAQRMSALIGRPSEPASSDLTLESALSALEEEWSSQKLMLAASAKKSALKKRQPKEAPLQLPELMERLEELLAKEAACRQFEPELVAAWQRVSGLASKAMCSSSAQASAAIDKVAIRDFQIGDIGLFLPTRHPNLWSAFHVQCPHYYLDLASLGPSDRGPSWNLGRIVAVEEKVAQKGHGDQIDKGRVFPAGFIYHLVKTATIAKG